MKLEVATYMLTFCEIDTYQNLVVCIRIASEIIDEIENKLWNFLTFTNQATKKPSRLLAKNCNWQI